MVKTEGYGEFIIQRSQSHKQNCDRKLSCSPEIGHRMSVGRKVVTVKVSSKLQHCRGILEGFGARNCTRGYWKEVIEHE